MRWLRYLPTPGFRCNSCRPTWCSAPRARGISRPWRSAVSTCGVLTNSLAATDVAAVHAGYAKRRKQLLAAGIKLYELRPTGQRPDERDLAGPFGSSGSSLHAKTFATDDRTLFIGSFNFDPRSANLNTEMGFLIDSPTLARTMHAAFVHEVPARAWEVRRDADGKLYWLLRQGNTVQRFDTEPGTSWLRRMSVRLFALLPIDWLL